MKMEIRPENYLDSKLRGIGFGALTGGDTLTRDFLEPVFIHDRKAPGLGFRSLAALAAEGHGMPVLALLRQRFKIN